MCKKEPRMGICDLCGWLSQQGCIIYNQWSQKRKWSDRCAFQNVKLGTSHYSFLDNVQSYKYHEGRIVPRDLESADVKRINYWRRVASRRAYAMMPSNSEDEANTEVWENIYRNLKESLKASYPFKKSISITIIPVWNATAKNILWWGRFLLLSGGDCWMFSLFMSWPWWRKSKVFPFTGNTSYIKL